MVESSSLAGVAEDEDEDEDKDEDNDLEMTWAQRSGEHRTTAASRPSEETVAAHALTDPCHFSFTSLLFLSLLLFSLDEKDEKDEKEGGEGKLRSNSSTSPASSRRP